MGWYLGPHLPVRPPCPTLISLARRQWPACERASCAPSLGEEGWQYERRLGTYSPPFPDRRLLATPASRSRVADCDPHLGRLFGIPPASRLGSPLYRPLSDVCSPGHEGRTDLKSSPPSSVPAVAASAAMAGGSLPRVPSYRLGNRGTATSFRGNLRKLEWQSPVSWGPGGNSGWGFRPLWDWTQRLTARADNSHTTPVPGSRGIPREGRVSPAGPDSKPW